MGPRNCLGKNKNIKYKSWAIQQNSAKDTDEKQQELGRGDEYHCILKAKRRSITKKKRNRGLKYEY